MVDDLLKELLTSPLEAPTRRSRRRSAASDDPSTGITPDGEGGRGSRGDLPRVPMLWGVGAAIVGALIVFAGYSIAADDPAPTTTTTTSTTLAAAAIDDGSPSDLPESYTPVGDRLGMRVERILARDDGVFITVTTVVRNSFDPTATTGFQGGLWTLVLDDGRRLTSTVESFDALARGTVSIWFPADAYTPQQITSLELNGVATRTTNNLTLQSGGVALPPEDGTYASLDLVPSRFEIDAGVTLVAEAVELGRTDARLLWRLDGSDLASASVVPIALTLTEDGIGGPAMFGAAQISGFTTSHPSLPGPFLTADGEVRFALNPGQELPTGIEYGAGIDIQVTWAVYEPLVVILSIEDAAIAEVTG